MKEETIEGMVEVLVKAKESRPKLFTEWEREFIDTMADVVQNWHLTEKKAIKYARGRVLDIGCGAGRHALYLQDKGL